jgi:hypothetical protein
VSSFGGILINLGFDTIGNATAIVYDNGPVLVTDPWITDSAYFGSWRKTHAIPPEQMEAIKSSKYVWFSHGHPDHLNSDSLEFFREQKILVPNHVGGRIKRDFEDAGFDTELLVDRQWRQLSEKVRVMCICDYFQDAIILIDVGGRLIINTNDANDRGWGRFARKIAKPYKTKFLLALFGFGDADMINFHHEAGIFIEPKAAKRIPVGKNMADAAASWGAQYVTPFSSMHHYQRSDSVWANKYVTELPDYAEGFSSKTCELTPAFVRYDCERDEFTPIDPPAVDERVYEPSEFGDDWSEQLSSEEVTKVSAYFGRIEHLGTFLDFVNFRVGGKDNNIGLSKKNFNRGLTFEVPRGSLMTAIEYNVFDDLLIGNFMKTILHGKWSKMPLYPDFTPYVTRYGDNANAYSKDELDHYFEEYQKRAGLDFALHRFESRAINMFRARIEGGSKVFQAGKRMYWFFKGLTSKI